MSELLLIKLVNEVHSECVCGMAVHDNAVVGIDGKAGHMAHKVSGKLACESAAVSVAPHKLCGLAVLCDTDDTEICFGGNFNVLEVFAGAGYHKVLADEGLCVEAGRNCSDDLCEVEVLGELILVDHNADVTASQP